ncbi:MAG: hypothetical protein ACHQT8_08065 [Chlamydiales bacterium]
MTSAANCVNSNRTWANASSDILQLICGFTFYKDCAQPNLVCKTWSRVFTPYNALKNSGEMDVFKLSRTCPPFGGYARERAQMVRAYEILEGTKQKTFPSLKLQYLTEAHVAIVSRLINSQALHALTELCLENIPSRKFLQSMREGCPRLRSIIFHTLLFQTPLESTSAMCDELNACKNLTETTIHAVQSDEDLQKLQRLNSLTCLEVEDIGRTTTPNGLRHLAEGYPLLRTLCLSGGSAEEMPAILIRPWVERLFTFEPLASRLMDLRLSHLTRSESDYVAMFLSKASKLQALTFSNSDLHSECVSQFPKCPFLTDLNISCHNTGITEETIKTIGQCAKLRFLKVDLPRTVDFNTALNHLKNHKTLEDLTFAHDKLKLSFNPWVFKPAAEQLVTCVQTMPALRVLELDPVLHFYVVKQLPHHNVYVEGGRRREKYKLLPAPVMEKTESKNDGGKK